MIRPASPSIAMTRLWASAAPRASCAIWKRSSAMDPVDGTLRHRPHALGHARPSHRRKRPSAPRLHGRHRRGAQRHRRELSAAQAAARKREGHVFKTETDTEVIAHLVEKHFEGNLEEAVRDRRQAADRRLRAGRARAHRSRTRSSPRAPARPWSSASATASTSWRPTCPPSCSHTRDMFFLADGDMAVLTPEGVRLSDFDGRPVNRQVSHVLWDPIMAEKGGYKHFMLKEIFEQPRAVRDTTLGRVGQETGRIFLDEMDISPKQFRAFRADQDHRLRHQLARRAGGQIHDREAGAHSRGSGLRQRVPLSRPDRRRPTR